MDASVSSNLFTTTYTRQTEQGPYAQHGSSDTAAAQADANSIHKEAQRVYDIDDSVDAALKQEVISVVK